MAAFEVFEFTLRVRLGLLLDSEWLLLSEPASPSSRQEIVGKGLKTKREGLD